MKPGLVMMAVAIVVSGHARAQEVSSIVHEGIVAAPVSEGWTAFTRSDGLREWLAPTSPR